MSKKPTAADRPQFRRDVADWMRGFRVKTAELGSGDVLVCARAADFDPATNVLWEMRDNQSAVRPDVRCLGCGSALAVSNRAYERYMALDEKPRPYCIECAAGLVK